jgi:hypothetical protein
VKFDCSAVEAVTEKGIARGTVFLSLDSRRYFAMKNIKRQKEGTITPNISEKTAGTL